MPNGVLFNISRLSGLFVYDAEGNFSPCLALWSTLVLTFWVSSRLATKFYVYFFEPTIRKTDLLSDTLWDLEEILNALSLFYHLHVIVNYRKRFNTVISEVKAVRPGPYDQRYFILTSAVVLVSGIFWLWDSKSPLELLYLSQSFFPFYANFILLFQFCSSLERLSVKFDKIKSAIPTSHRVDYHGHSNLVKVSEEANRMYDVQLLLICSNIFISILACTYSLYCWRTSLNSSYVLSTTFVLMVVATYCSLFCLANACEDINESADAFNKELFKSMRRKPEYCNNDAYYLYVLRRRTVHVSACGYFDIGSSIITAVTGAAATYLVILIQNV